MRTAAARRRTTPNLSAAVALTAPEIELAERLVLDAIRACTAGDSWRKKDLLRGRVRPLISLMRVVVDVQRRGSSPAEIEGVMIALHNAVRRALGVRSDTRVTFEDAVRREQARENAGNLDSLLALPHQTAGELWRWRQDLIAEIDAERSLVDLIDERLLTMGAAR